MIFAEKFSAEHQNAFLDNPFLTRNAAEFSQTFLEEFKAIGKFVVSKKAQDLARLANQYPPKLIHGDCWGQRENYVELHPAYHALVRRAKRIGLASSLWESNEEEKEARYQLRTIRLFLIAGLENGHLTELINTNAAIGAFMANERIYQSWKDVLFTRQHDSSEVPFLQKKGVSFTFAFQEEQAFQAQGKKESDFTQATVLGGGLYQLKGIKHYVNVPMADAFFVTAYLAQGLSCFFVPRYLEDGQLNGINIQNLVQQAGYRSAGSAMIEFNQSRAWLLGRGGEAQKLIDDIEMMLRFDEAVISAGSLRSAFQFALLILYRNKKIASSSFVQRLLADIALDIAAAQALIMRLARAFDHAIEDKNEAAFARVMTPVIAFWVHNLLAPIMGELLAQLPEFAYEQNGFLPRMLNDGIRRCLREQNTNRLVEAAIETAKKAPTLLKDMIAQQGQKIHHIGHKTVEVLYAAMDIALADMGAARLFVEQLAYASALAALYEYEVPLVAEAFAESRLGGQWRSSYGMLSMRREPEKILSALYGLSASYYSSNDGS